jgi:hypothetical protein
MRRRVKQQTTLVERLVEQARKFREQASEAPAGTARELLLKRARQAEASAQLSGWLASGPHATAQSRSR